MSRRKNALMIITGILIGFLLAGPAASAVETFLQAYPSSHTFYLDGRPIQMEAYVINGNNYVKLRDIGQAVDFNVYWQDGVQIDSASSYTGEAPAQAEELDEVRAEMVRLINEVRRENGVAELTVDQRLMDAAQECSSRKYTYHHTKEECEVVLAHGYQHGFGNNLCILTAAAPAGIARGQLPAGSTPLATSEQWWMHGGIPSALESPWTTAQPIAICSSEIPIPTTHTNKHTSRMASQLGGRLLY